MYFLRGEEPAFEDAGSKVAFCRSMISDEELRAALRYAMGRWGSAVRLSGGDAAFQERAARMLTELGGKPIGGQQPPATSDKQPVQGDKDSGLARKGRGR